MSSMCLFQQICHRSALVCEVYMEQHSAVSLHMAPMPSSARKSCDYSSRNRATCPWAFQCGPVLPLGHGSPDLMKRSLCAGTSQGKKGRVGL
eukprot:CAMPEP_0174316798 /NCGR_PEP_ID=MMETSP0810-20121108/7191_1 /TAXON_ID=73025 ORGANISM="Eutreptiella gymnastica-like, Strain CCMP1594" /NCGR_SAMPLE_ID=MMETSP0810 /ASSEMBLY_ACC=CAM_ASM_000659 /LENGTH=91 /DNA_ID=CAMNT_0015426633 /DNA_START=829 /DNA_END=1104 /DNA_ORIENTATION=-